MLGKIACVWLVFVSFLFGKFAVQTLNPGDLLASQTEGKNELRKTKVLAVTGPTIDVCIYANTFAQVPYDVDTSKL